jgi:NAD(P)-dependent dehydrogenase (short-subunit alcohol dehydrogenase family)
MYNVSRESLLCHELRRGYSHTPMKKQIFITGASSGFGKLTVPLLLQKGHSVIAAMRGGSARLSQVFPEELKKYPKLLTAIDLSLEKTSEVLKTGTLLEQSYGGKLDVLINNAGFGLMGVLEETSEEQLRYQMEVNFFGAAFLTQSLLPLLRRSKGRILNVSSISGLSGFPFYGSYCASKFALEGLMQGLAFDLAPFGVQVGMINPGGFKTEFISNRAFAEKADNPDSVYFKRNRAFLDTFKKSSVRLDDPIVVAQLISKLCDEKKVPFQNVIGKDARAAVFLKYVLPMTGYRKMVNRVFEIALSKKQ